MTMSIAGSLMTSRAFAVRSPGGSVMPRSVVRSRSATFTKASGTPSRCRITPALVVRTLATPVPTVPNPIKPTAMRSFTKSPYSSQPESLSAFLMPRIACRVRCSFSTRPKRTYSSPYSPNPRPGDTATFASCRSSLENSSDPMVRYASGIRAQTNMVARGFSTFQRNDGGDLDRLEDAIVEVAFDFLQGADHLGIAHAEPHPPARHVVALGQGEELHTHVPGARDLEKARGLVPIEDDVRIGQVVGHIDVVFLREGHHLLEERQVHDGRGRIVREVEDQHLGTWQRAAIGLHQVLEEIAVLAQRDPPHHTARDDDAVRMDRIGGRGGQDHLSDPSVQRHHRG